MTMYGKGRVGHGYGTLHVFDVADEVQAREAIEAMFNDGSGTDGGFYARPTGSTGPATHLCWHFSGNSAARTKFMDDIILNQPEAVKSKLPPQASQAAKNAIDNLVTRMRSPTAADLPEQDEQGNPIQSNIDWNAFHQPTLAHPTSWRVAGGRQGVIEALEVIGLELYEPAPQ